MRKEITYEELEKAVEEKKQLIKNIIPNSILILIIFAFSWLFSRSLTIGLFFGFSVLSFYLIFIYIKLKKNKNIIFLYEEQDYIESEKKEIKKHLNRLRNLLIYLNLEESRINYNVDKYLNMISNAQNLQDFKNITASLKEKIAKYSELLGEDEKDYNYSKSYKDANASKFSRDFNFNDYSNNYGKKYTYTEKTYKSYSKYDEETLKYLNILELKELPKNKKELKNIYRNMLKKYHPDNIKNKENKLTEKELENKTAAINTAYEFLIKKI